MKNKFLESLMENNPPKGKSKPANDVAKKAFTIPFFKLLLAPFNNFVKYFSNLVLLIFLYSTVLSILALAFGHPLMCMYPGAEMRGLFCSQIGYSYLVYEIIKILVMTGFIISFCGVISGQKLTLKGTFPIGMKNLRVLAAMVAYLLLNSAMLLSYKILEARTPNPNWKIETAFFVVASVGFWVPFLLMRFYSLFIYFIEKGKLASLKMIWVKTSGSTFKILISLFAVLIFSLLLASNFYVGAKSAFDMDIIWYSAIMAEYLESTILLVIIGLMVGHMQAQRSILIED